MLKEKVVVITGAGGGLGFALVKEFLAQGCSVVGIVRSEESLAKLAVLEGFSPYVADVSNPVAVTNIFCRIVEKFGRVDILFNNAAVYPKVNFLEESGQQWLDAIAVNLGGIANCSKAVLPTMIRHGFGRIYNLGSFADINPIANSVAYSCSKGGVHGLTKAIAADIANLNKDIEVHEWIPGHLNTQMSDFTGMDPALSAKWAVDIASGKIKASKKSTLFENDREWLPPKSLKRRIVDKLLFWK
jgi:NAD(P)-dependent dehydrogenase (short-subunit alcohol dehydrogenase family)